jgi:hypothetical protein
VCLEERAKPFVPRQIRAKYFLHGEKAIDEFEGLFFCIDCKLTEKASKRILHVDFLAAFINPGHIAHPCCHSEASAIYVQPILEAISDCPKQALGSFWEPSIAICQVRCFSAGFAKRSISASR